MRDNVHDKEKIYNFKSYLKSTIFLEMYSLYLCWFLMNKFHSGFIFGFFFFLSLHLMTLYDPLFCK